MTYSWCRTYFTNIHLFIMTFFLCIIKAVENFWLSSWLRLVPSLPGLGSVPSWGTKILLTSDGQMNK